MSVISEENIMEIQSAFNSGIQGFQKATEDASKAAYDIASNTAAGEQASTVGASETSQVNLQTQSQPNLTQSVVDLKVAEHQARSSAEVVQTADETLGTLLDVRV